MPLTDKHRGRPKRGQEHRFFHSIEREKAYRRGYAAYLNGSQRKWCPFDYDTELALYCEWQAGFSDAGFQENK